MFTRRQILKSGIAAGALVIAPRLLAEDIQKGLNDSDLVYITPIQSSGRESACQAEIWFVWDGAAVFVCTDTTSWRAVAPTKGLDDARIWVGDVGNWTRADGKYRALPQMMAKTRVITDTTVHEKALDLFGDKYPVGWLRWGSSFRKGLKDGSRTLLRYQPV